MCYGILRELQKKTHQSLQVNHLCILVEWNCKKEYIKKKKKKSGYVFET